MLNKILWTVAVLIPAVHAQFLQQGGKLTGSGASGSPIQGYSVAVSADGNTAIAGSPGDSGAVGAAWVYVRANGLWTQQGPKLVGSSAANPLDQGISVALSADGDTALMGDFEGGWVFTRAGGVWGQGLRLAPAGITQYRSVAISGDGNTALVGGPGAVSAFTRANGVWTLDSALPLGPGAADAGQGWAVALSADGKTALVGGNGDNLGAGSALVFTRVNGAWTQQGPKLTASDTVGASGFAISVALSADGSTAILGGERDANFIGAAWIFTRTNGVWTQQGPKLVGTGAVGNANQGTNVSISADGNTALSSGRIDSQAIGATWAFTRTNGVWAQQGSRLVGTGWTGAPPFSAPEQGRGVALSGDGHTAMVGGPYDQPLGGVWAFVSAAVHFSVSAPATVTAGTPFNFTVTALNPDNSVDTSYSGTVHFFATTPFADLPPDSTLANGVGTFSAVLKSAINLVPGIGATDTVNPLITGTSGPINLQAAATSRFVFPGVPSTVASGTAFSFNITAQDRFGNFASSNTARVRFTSTDPAATLPPETFMPSGIGTFSAILRTAGNQTITVTDTTDSSITGTSPLITVGGSQGATNLAQGKFASQSTTYSSAAVASRAIDGSTDGNFYNGSVTATTPESNPWWQVDLTGSASIDSITIWNRTDCCASRLNDYWVFVSDTPFLATDTTDTLQNRAGTVASHPTTAPNPSITIPINGQGRYVRVQIPGSAAAASVLSLAEVQVFGTLLNPPSANLSQGKPTSQSSNYPGYATDASSAAVDGSTDGNFFNGSVTATTQEPSPWWQVDLGAPAAVNSVALWNRTDCCGSRLNNYWVFVSNTPFLPTDTPATLQNRAGTFAVNQTSAPDPAAVIAIGGTTGFTGRYVRIQLAGSGVLSLAEVQVLGAGGAPAPGNVALGKVASQSSTLPGYTVGGAGAAVDGNTDGGFFNGSVTATDFENSPWWQVDLGASTALSSITIWNRTDCCGSRLNDYWVFVSDTPFLATDTPATLQNRAATFASHQTSAPSPATSIPAVAQGRYVRVQLASPNFLSLAEVQVFGQ